MISPFDIVEAGPRPTRDGVVSDLLVRSSRSIYGIHFASLDEPVACEEDEEKAAAEAAEDLAAAKRAEAAEELRLRVEGARTDAGNEARQRFEMELDMKLVEERRRMDRVRVEFARDRQRFFAAAESQVVKLALAVARKILQRDAMTEGLQLRATVKAALVRVQDGSTTVLSVPASEVEQWRAMFVRGSAGKVEVVADERLEAGECSLETSVGKVDLGTDVQLEQVELGFSELMQEQGY
jgi:flagellar assembly protein FliH